MDNCICSSQMHGGHNTNKNGPLQPSISPVRTDAEDAPAAVSDLAALSDSELREAASSLSTAEVAPLKAIIVDGSAEFAKSAALKAFCDHHHIAMVTSAAYTHTFNARAEGAVRTRQL